MMSVDKKNTGAMNYLCIAEWNIQMGIPIPELLVFKYAPFRADRQHDINEGNLLFSLTDGEVAMPPKKGGYVHPCENGTEWTFYPQPEGYLVKLYMPMYGRTYLMRADREWKQVVTDWKAKDAEDAWALDNIIMLSFAVSSAFRNTVLMHASCIRTTEGEGMAFIGQSGAGKSTHSRLWLKYISGCTLLNDDQPAVRIHEGIPYIYGTPWSGKGDCYKQEKARLHAVYLMQQAQENILLPLEHTAAFATVLSAVSVVKEMREAMKGVLDTVAAITLQTQVAVLKNKPEKEAVMLSAGGIEKKEIII